MDHNDEIGVLVIESGKGNNESFKALYELLVDKVFGYIQYRSKSEDDALDLTQEVFVDLYKVLPSFTYTSKEQFYSFVFTVSKRKLAKYYAHRHIAAIKNKSEFDEEAYGAPAENLEETRDVAAAVAKLDDVSRDIVVLHHWSRYTFPEIASLTNMTVSAVRVRHHRALKTLSASLNPQ